MRLGKDHTPAHHPPAVSIFKYFHNGYSIKYHHANTAIFAVKKFSILKTCDTRMF